MRVIGDGRVNTGWVSKRFRMRLPHCLTLQKFFELKLVTNRVHDSVLEHDVDAVMVRSAI